MASGLVVLCIVGEWFVHHPRQWVAERCATLPESITAPILWAGNTVSDITDGLGWTGRDSVHKYDCKPPNGHVCFAGIPKRIGKPAPADITVLDRGDFKIGWSPSLRHPVWCTYHVIRNRRHPLSPRPNFAIDRSARNCPRPGDYRGSKLDRGHMAPNYAIATRYGEHAQTQTFLMSNISPQPPALNRGVWRNVEHRIADLWTARYGEIWVTVGAVSPSKNRKSIFNTGIDIPTHFYQVIIAQEGMEVRAMAMIFNADAPWDTWAARNLITIRELESITGLNFNPKLPTSFSDAIETDLPTRLWPVRLVDIFNQMVLGLTQY